VKSGKLYYVVHKDDWKWISRSPKPWDFENIAPFGSLKSAMLFLRGEYGKYEKTGRNGTVRHIIVKMDYSFSKCDKEEKL